MTFEGRATRLDSRGPLFFGDISPKVSPDTKASKDARTFLHVLTTLTSCAGR